MREAPHIAAQTAITAQHAMAGNKQRNRVLADGRGHGAYRARLANLGGQRAIACGCAKRDGAQPTPDLKLKRTGGEMTDKRCGLPGEKGF